MSTQPTIIIRAKGTKGDRGIQGIQGHRGTSGYLGMDLSEPYLVNDALAFDITTSNFGINEHGAAYWCSDSTAIPDNERAGFNAAERTVTSLSNEMWSPPRLGIQGLSAYEVAVSEGYVGSEAAWLESLKSYMPGPTGPTGPQGAPVVSTNPPPATGTGAAGTSTNAAREDHTHDIGQHDLMHLALLAGHQPSSSRIESFPRLFANGATLGSTGTLYVMFFTPFITKSVSSFNVFVTVIGGTMSLARLTLFSVDASDNLTAIAESSNATTWATATGKRTASFDTARGLPASVTLNARQRYAWGLLVVGTGTMPTVVTSGVPTQASNLYIEDPRVATSVTGQTDTPLTQILASSFSGSGVNPRYCSFQ